MSGISTNIHYVKNITATNEYLSGNVVTIRPSKWNKRMEMF